MVIISVKCVKCYYVIIDVKHLTFISLLWLQAALHKLSKGFMLADVVAIIGKLWEPF